MMMMIIIIIILISSEILRRVDWQLSAFRRFTQLSFSEWCSRRRIDFLQ